MDHIVNNRYSNGRKFKDLDPEQKILSRSAGFRVQSGKSAEEALSLLKHRIWSENFTAGSSDSLMRGLIIKISSIAAACLLVLGLGYMALRGRSNQVVADKGSHIDYSLPDGSKVIINADSKIVFNKKDFNRKRTLILEGEAFFNVEKGTPFIISTKNADIKVLGTSFNVYSRDDLFKVTCLTGKISVSDKNDSVEIMPGESASLDGKELIFYKDKNANTSAGWIDGEFYFENSPLSVIFKEMERQFNVKFVTGEIESKYFTGSFTNNDLKNALEIVCIPMGLKYEIGKNGRIQIREKTQ
jgi:transmembrane sensor